MPELTPQQKLLEKLYRKTPLAKPTPSAAQQQLQNLYNKSTSPNGVKKNAGKVSKKVLQQSKTRAIHRKNARAIKGHIRRGRAAIKNARPAAAKNISKFGGGVAKKLAPTLGRIKGVAASVGVKAAPLATTLTSSKFLASANSLPVLALAAVATAVWKQNIKSLATIYGVDLPSLTTFLPSLFPPTQAPQSESGFYGGQDPNRTYRLRFGIARANSTGFQEWVESVSGISLVPPYADVKLLINGQDSGVTEHWGYSNVGSGNPPPDGRTKRRYNIVVINESGHTETVISSNSSGIKIFGFEPTDGLPETVQTTIINNFYNYTLPSRQPEARPNKQPEVDSLPKTRLKTPPSKPANNPRLFPTPSIIPIPSIQPGDNTTTEPQKPTDSPIVKPTDNTTPTKRRKPNSSTRTTYYPDALPFKRPGTEVIKNNQSGVDTVIRRKYPDTEIPENGTEITQEIPRGIPPAIRAPTVQPKNKPQPDLPPRTKINNCKKGCSGGSGGISSTTLTNNNAAIVNSLNDLLLQNGLLKKIDQTTTGTQLFMKKAWNSTLVDKAINGATLIAALHNAAQLSQNVAVSLGDTATAAMQGLGIKDSEGLPIDVNAIVGSRIRTYLTSIFGAGNLNAASESWKKLNRIHQASASIVNSIQGTKNALLEADEITGGNLAKLANTLLTEGQVEADAYELMNEQPDYQTQFAGILGKINAIDEISDRVSSVVSSGLEIKENIGELVDNSDELKKATDDFRIKKKVEENAKDIASLSPTIDRFDLLKKEPEN